MSSSLDQKCQRCHSRYQGELCPFCTVTGLDANALIAQENLKMKKPATDAEAGNDQIVAEGAVLVDIIANRTYSIQKPVCRFGRDISNDIVLIGDKSLSRFHFQITESNDEYFIEDAGSRNGTFLNGSPVNSPRKVVDGDVVSAG